MSKILFFDADGVTVASREKFFSQRLSEDYGVPTELVLPLFKNEFYKCVLGEMDLKEVLKTYMSTWGWNGTVDELLHYWWSGENKLNAPVIEIIDQVRLKGTKCYLATDQEKYRANYIMEGMGLGNHLDGAFFSSDLGLSKATPEYWNKVLNTLGIQAPEGVKYWDDEQENIDAAKEVGIDACLYKDISDINNLTTN